MVALWDVSGFLFCSYLVVVSGSLLQRFLFLLVWVAFTLHQALPWYHSAVANFGLCCVFASIDVLCLLFVSYIQFVVLSSFVGHSSSVPSPPLSLGA